MRRAIGTYEIDDDPARIDPAAAAAFLTTQAYWGRWRGEPDIRGQVAGAWRVTGVYDQAGAMVGFARACSDGGSAYLADVYVLPAHRGAGLGQAIVAMMVDGVPGSAGAGQRWMLHTADAHGLYRQFGFAAPDGRYLERPAEYGREPVPAATDALAATDSPSATGVLTGERVRLEPLGHGHVPGLAAAAVGGGDLYRWTGVPRDTDEARRYVESALAARDRGTAVPFAVVRAADGAVIGSTRFWDLVSWPWPDRKATPDTCEIGHTWLSRDAIRTGANTEMKRLMLTHAFETWAVQSVCLHTDARNQRSRDAIERIGATFEGILRAHRLAAELAPRDSARFSVTAAEWPAVRRHLAELTARYGPVLSGPGRPGAGTAP